MNTLRHSLAIPVAALALLSASPAESREKTPKALLESAELALRENRHADAAQQIDQAYESMRKTKLTEPAGSLLARTHLLRAIAAAGQGRLEDAGFDWTVAVAFDPKVAEIGLQPYGEAATRLTAAAREVYAIRGRAEDIKTDGISGGKLKNELERPDFPNHWTNCMQTRVQVEAWIDDHGTVRGVGKVDSNCGSGLLLTALKTLRSRAYEPAVLDGQKVPVIQTVSFVMTIDRPLGAPVS
jgi:hypothetical protein